MYLNKAELNITNDYVHFGIADREMGQLQNSNILKRENGAWVLKPVETQFYQRKFGSLELYLAGLASATEVDRINFIKFDDKDGLIPDKAVPDSKVTAVDIQDIVRVYGTRSPAYAGAVRNMRMATTVVSTKRLSEAEAAYIELMLENLASNDAPNTSGDLTTTPSFAYACDFRCTMRTDISVKQGATGVEKQMLRGAPLLKPRIVPEEHLVKSKHDRSMERAKETLLK